MLGLIREGEGVAARVLENLGVDLAKVRQHIIRLLGETGATGTQTGGTGTGRSKTPTLDEFGVNLTQAATEGRLDPVVGREKEIERVIQILGRRTKNNPVLIGEPGVGKTAIAEGLAQRIAANEIPDILQEKKIVQLDIGLLVAGTKYRGEFEERLKKIMDEIRGAGNVIIVIDELHTLIGAGAAEGAIDAANILKPALSRGELQCIGATTLDEYRKHIERDAALERRFQPVMVDAPSVEESIEILRGLRPKYEEHHKLIIGDVALIAAAVLSDRYISDRYLPDKAIDLIDEASSRVRLRASSLPPEGKEIEKELRIVSRQKEQAIRSQEFEKASQLRDKETELKEQIKEMQQKWKEQQEKNKPVVTEVEIAHIVSSWTGIPVGDLTQGESERLQKLEGILHERVIGQDVAVTAVSRAIRRARVGLKNPQKPIGTFMFSGPTGVGKTELAKALATFFYGAEENIIRVDMSEYMEKHTVSKLIGSPPGYVGYGEGGQLTEAVRRRPYSVVLFDEIEKAHPDVFNILLQILDDGRLTDSKGRVVDFKNTIIIMTSNVGARNIESLQPLGFSTELSTDPENIYKRMKSTVTDEMKKTFRPEFLNRLDDIIIFKHLLKEELHKILDLMVKDLGKRIDEKSMVLELSAEVKDKLVKDGYSQAYGARPMRRTLQKLIEDALAEEMLAGKFKEGDKIGAVLKRRDELPPDASIAKMDSSVTVNISQNKDAKDDGMVIVFEKTGTVEIKKKYEKKEKPELAKEVTKEEPQPPKEPAKAGS